MRKSAIVVCLLVLFHLFAFPKSTPAATDLFIGEVMMTAANFCPRGWAEANGRLLSINQHEALFALVGTMYGGDGWYDPRSAGSAGPSPPARGPRAGFDQ